MYQVAPNTKFDRRGFRRLSSMLAGAISTTKNPTFVSCRVAKQSFRLKFPIAKYFSVTIKGQKLCLEELWLQARKQFTRYESVAATGIARCATEDSQAPE